MVANRKLETNGKKHLNTQAQATDRRSESAAVLFVYICVLISCLFASWCIPTGSDVFAFTINVLCTHDHGLRSNSWMATGKNAQRIAKLQRDNLWIEWMYTVDDQKKLGTTPMQSKLMLSFSILRIESAEPKCEELAVLSSCYHLSQAAASAFSLPFRHTPAASPPHIPLPRHKLDLFIYVCFPSHLQHGQKHRKNMAKWCQVGRFKHQRLLSSLKCPASRACASNAAFLERQLHASKTACPNAVRAFVSYIMFSLQHFLSQQVPQLCASS